MATILVVDHSASSRELVGSLLESEHHTIAYASDGAEALARIEKEPPDMVVTDLFMPEVDGFSLVSRLRSTHPHIPVILVTSRGSEETAARALREGAASYVCKAELPHGLLDAVDEVLDATIQARTQARIMRGLTRYEATFVLENDRDLFQPLVHHLQEQLEHLRLCTDDSQRTCLGVALGEALVNAAEHGNLELDSALREEDRDSYLAQAEERRKTVPYSERRVRLGVCLTRDEATFTISDDGAGFDPAGLPDPTNPENLLKSTGRGVMLMRTFMDKVIFNSTGNQVTLVKYRKDE